MPIYVLLNNTFSWISYIASDYSKIIKEIRVVGVHS